MLIESGMGCCCQKEDALFWKNRHIDAMKQLVQVRQENLELRECLGDTNERLKDLNEKLDKATADYQALLAEHEEKIRTSAKCYASLVAERNGLAGTVTKMEKMIRDLDERNKNLRERLAKTNADLKRSIQENNKIQDEASYLDNLRRRQAKEIKRLRNIVDPPNGSCSPYTQQGMQSKIAKQANEIKRLTEENERLKRDNKALAEGLSDQTKRAIDLMSARETLKHEIETLHGALDIAAKDADANFERGKVKGMEEIWQELKDVYAGRPIGENEKIFGYYSVGDILMNLSPTWFMNKAREHHEQKEKEARDIKIGDEVEVFDRCHPDDNPDSDIGIVVIVDPERINFVVIGPHFEGCFDETDIKSGNVKKTGRHFDSIPLDYFA